MKTYQVTVKLTGEATVEVEAEDENDAAVKARRSVNFNFDACEAGDIVKLELVE